jgi:hypothetical protein
VWNILTTRIPKRNRNKNIWKGNNGFWVNLKNRFYWFRPPDRRATKPNPENGKLKHNRVQPKWETGGAKRTKQKPYKIARYATRKTLGTGNLK